MAHLHNVEGVNKTAIAWLAVSEQFKKTQDLVTKLATRGMQ
jgi:hypothetical protein